MKRIVINASLPGETRIALLKRNQVSDLMVERFNEPELRGSVFLGRVNSLNKALKAAFVDIGQERDAFLRIESEDEALNEGDSVIVQGVHDSRATHKGARVTRQLHLAARALVLLPQRPGEMRVSKVLQSSGKDFTKAQNLCSQLEIPEDVGILVRNSVRNSTLDDLQMELDEIVRVWRDIEATAKVQTPAVLLYLDGTLIGRTMREHFRPSIDEIVVDDEHTLEEVRQMIETLDPARLGMLKHHDEKTPIFESYGVEAQVNVAMDRHVSLPSGGELVFDQTEAMTTIDINTASTRARTSQKHAIISTNLEAAKEIARQVRIRDIGGLIVIDFIDMDTDDEREQVEKALEAEFQFDRARTAFCPISRFGLLEMTRQRIGSELATKHGNECKLCQGTGWVLDPVGRALSLLREVETEAAHSEVGEIRVRAEVSIINLLGNELREALRALEERQDIKVRILSDPAISHGWQLEKLQGESPLKALSHQIKPLKQQQIEEQADLTRTKAAVPAARFVSSQQKPRQKTPRHSKNTAPTPAPASPGLLGKLVSLFSPKPEEPVIQKQERPNRRGRSNRGRSNAGAEGTRQQDSRQSARRSNNGGRRRPNATDDRRGPQGSRQGDARQRSDDTEQRSALPRPRRRRPSTASEGYPESATTSEGVERTGDTSDRASNRHSRNPSRSTQHTEEAAQPPVKNPTRRNDSEAEDAVNTNKGPRTDNSAESFEPDDAVRATATKDASSISGVDSKPQDLDATTSNVAPRAASGATERSSPGAVSPEVPVKEPTSSAQQGSQQDTAPSSGALESPPEVATGPGRFGNDPRGVADENNSSQ